MQHPFGMPFSDSPFNLVDKNSVELDPQNAAVSLWCTSRVPATAGSGSLVDLAGSRRIVLTAAHVLYDKKEKQLRGPQLIALHTLDATKVESYKYTSMKAWVPEEYKNSPDDAYEYDYGLIVLDNAVSEKDSGILKLVICPQPPPPPSEFRCRIAGYPGHNAGDGKEYDPCKDLDLKGGLYWTSGLVVAVDGTFIWHKASTCHGSSGAALVGAETVDKRKQQIGIVFGSGNNLNIAVKMTQTLIDRLDKEARLLLKDVP